MTENPARSQRKSLTKSQLENPDALELLALLQGVAADGRLHDDEIRALRDWLTAHGDSTLPAIVHLCSCVEVVLGDGVVSDEERAYLQKAVETVLPVEHRDVAVLRRREVKSADKSEAQRVAEEERLRQQDLAKRSRPIARFDFMVAGTSHGVRKNFIHDYLDVDDPVFLVREPSNAHDRNAILVRIAEGHDIGYVPATEARRLAPLLDEGALQASTVKKVLDTRGGPVPVVWGELYSADAPVGHAVPASQVPPEKLGAGCLFSLALCVGLFAVSALALVLA